MNFFYCEMERGILKSTLEKGPIFVSEPLAQRGKVDEPRQSGGEVQHAGDNLYSRPQHYTTAAHFLRPDRQILSRSRRSEPPRRRFIQERAIKETRPTLLGASRK